MKLLIPVLSFSFTCLYSSIAAANDCSFVGGQFERLHHDANVDTQVAQLSRIQTRLETLIAICGGQPSEAIVVDVLVGPTNNIGAQPDSVKGPCDSSTISRKSTEASNAILAQKGRIDSHVGTIEANINELSKLLLTCKP